MARDIVFFSQEARRLNLANFPLIYVREYGQTISFHLHAVGRYMIISLPPPLPTIFGILLASIPAIIVVMVPIRRFWRSIDQDDGLPARITSGSHKPALQHDCTPAGAAIQPSILEYSPRGARTESSIPPKWRLTIAVWVAAFIVFIIRQIILTPAD